MIGHSRGACDARLAFALENPEFVADHIQAWFLVQGPFGGTGAADYVVGEGPPLDSQMPLRTQGCRSRAGTSGRLPAGPGQARRASGTHQAVLRGVLGTGPGGAPSRDLHRQSEDVLRDEPDRSLTAPTLPASDRVGPVLPRPNDGLVALDDQNVPGLGTVLAVLDAGHRDLTVPIPRGPPKPSPAESVDRRDRHGGRRKFFFPR